MDTSILAAGQVLVGGFSGLKVPPKLMEAFAEGSIGGVTFFSRNIDTPKQLHALIKEIEWPQERPPLLAIDQEGGRVARLKSPVVKLPPMRELAQIGDPSLTERAAALLGSQLRAIGLTMNFAPVLDVDTNPDNPVIGDRSFGARPKEVILHARAFAAGLADAGVLSCGKHFPGHGDTLLDSHLALPTVKHTLARLEAVELLPFRQALDFPAFMTAHVVFPELDAHRPATLSPHVVGDLLRHDMGYEGVIISDDLEMKAVAKMYSIAESAILAIEAGCDVLLVCSDTDALFDAREELAARARRDVAFRTRLDDAAERSLRLRRSAPPTPAPNLSGVFDASTLFERELETHLGQRHA
ncbi:MAG: beta-N-acetylhexosaminidase [Polyangiales bacterium]